MTRTEDGRRTSHSIVGTLETNGAKGSFLSASSSAAGETGLTFVGDATVKDLELDVFGTAITANKGKLTLSNLNFILNRVNVDLKGTAQATLNNAYVFVGNGQTAVSVGEQARLTMDAGVLENVAGCAGGDGIFAAENAILQVKNTRFSGFGARTIGMVGQATGSISNSEFTNAASCDGSRVLFLNEQAHLKLDTVNSTATKGLPSEFVELGGHTILEANRLTISNYTLAVDAQGAASIITLTNSTFQNNTTAFLGGNGGQLNVSKSSFLNNNTGLRGFYIKLRNSSVLGGEVGIDAISEKVDLGTVNDPGNNIFRSSSDTSVQFFSHSSSVELFAIGNIWNGNTQGALSDGKYPLSIDRIGINNLLANGQNFKLVPPSATPFVYAIRLNP